MMVSAEITNSSPQTVVYKIKPEAVWDDGTPIDAADFTYAWKTRTAWTAPTARPLRPPVRPHRVDHRVGQQQDGHRRLQDETTLTGRACSATCTRPTSPASTATWPRPGSGSTRRPDYSAGPYKITDFQKDPSVTEVPNPKWFGATKPQLDKVIFRIITDQTQEVPALQNNEVQAIYPSPTVTWSTRSSRSGCAVLPGQGPDLGAPDLNLKNTSLADKVLRTAIFRHDQP